VKRSLVQYLAFVTAIYAIRKSKSHMFENNNKKIS
jgi:prophage maintenance system killer protein